MKTINRIDTPAQRRKETKSKAFRRLPNLVKSFPFSGSPLPSSFFHDSITLGEFRIALHNGTPWVFHKDGENMQTSVAALESALSKFWEEEF
jgi:hypothetical protein